MTANVELSVLNGTSQKAIVYVGIVAELDVVLNNTGGDITLVPGQSPSSFTIYFPSYYTAADIKAMNVVLTDWTLLFDANGPNLVLTYIGTEIKWTGALKFRITNAMTTGSPSTGVCQVNFNNMKGAPSYVTCGLTLSKAVQPGNASLTDALQVSLENQGSVIVSTATAKDPLQNTLYLNFKNITNADLYTGQSPGTPSVTVTFIYGMTSGALAPDDDKKVTGSAWNIVGAVSITQSGFWNVAPANPSSDPHPKWTLTPASTNIGVIGSGANANVTFSFSKIVSELVPGHTQMLVAFSGFKQSDTTNYDDHVFPLDIIKQNPPPTRGLLNFYSTNNEPIINISSNTTQIDLPFRWVMRDVVKINLISSFPGTRIYKKSYGTPQNPPKPLDTDDTSITIPSTSTGGPVFATLQSFDGNGAFLNSMQYTVYLNMSVFVDPRDGKSYPIRLFNNKLWMTKNLDHVESGSEWYNKITVNEAQYGRLYIASASSVTTPPAGWHIPSVSDWKSLFDSYATPAAAYADLMKPAPDGFAAELGGKYDSSNGSFDYITQFGYYRCSGSSTVAGFVSSSKTVNTAGTLPDNIGLSIRYVKDL